MLFTILPPGRVPQADFQTRFALQQDHWNDFSFQTLYHLYFKNDLNSRSPTLLGSVKILKRGQTAADPILLKDPFDTLGPDFCSVGTSLDYYQRLNRLEQSDRDQIVLALHDVAAQPGLIPKFSSEEGWKVSLFRDNSEWSDFLSDATALLQGKYDSLPDLAETFTFTPANGTSEIAFNFASPRPRFYPGPYRLVGPSKKEVLLPQRVFVLVGRNGSGKSTLLSRIAHIAFASPQERAESEMKALGVFSPSTIGFMRVITISYSAFDSFTVPGTREKDLAQITSDLDSGEGRFVFCGLRDIASEGRDDLANIGDRADDAGSQRRVSYSDRRGTTKLKSIQQLSEEFVHLIRRIKRDGKQQLFDAALDVLLSDPSFAELWEIRQDALSEDLAATTFLAWSTGHKIALHVIASLVANATRKSLVLFDEPEMHLHPPMAAALMHAVRLVLEEVNAFCIVATHSPVICQETLAQHVRVIRRSGDQIDVRPPKLETFGENVGVLTYDTFGLTAAATDFHKTLDFLVESINSLDEIDKLFSLGLSAQARGYVLARMATKESKQ